MVANFRSISYLWGLKFVDGKLFSGDSSSGISEFEFGIISYLRKFKYLNVDVKLDFKTYDGRSIFVVFPNMFNYENTSKYLEFIEKNKNKDCIQGPHTESWKDFHMLITGEEYSWSIYKNIRLTNKTKGKLSDIWFDTYNGCWIVVGEKNYNKLKLKIQELLEKV